MLQLWRKQSSTTIEMRSLTEAERTRIFSESDLEEPEMPILVDPDLVAVEDFHLAGEAVGWKAGARRVVLRESIFSEYSDEQLRGVIAHEFGHHRGRHVLKSKIWKGLMVVVGLGIFVGGILGWIFTLNLWMLAALVAAYTLFVPFTMLSSAWLSRRLEYDADARAVDLLDDRAPLEALCEAEAAAPRPSSLRDRWYELCYPWPSSSERLRALRDDE